MEYRYCIGAGFGQQHDYTAVSVIERQLDPVGDRYSHERLGNAGKKVREVRRNVVQRLSLVRLDRVQLRTPYTTIARGLVRLVRELYDRHAESAGPVARSAVSHHNDPWPNIRVALAIDEGGVGVAVRDILLEELKEGLGKHGPKMVRVFAVTVHGGDRTNHDQGFWRVPKRDLVSSGVVAYQNRTLKVGDLRERDVLEKELTNYRLKQNLNTNYVGFEPLREGEHDDLVFATCLGTWTFTRAMPPPKFIPLQHHILTNIQPNAVRGATLSPIGTVRGA
jgi:hypothetical protein